MQADSFVVDPGTLVEWRGFRAFPDNLPCKMPGIYLIMHLATNRPYVGSSQNIEHRLHEHSIVHTKCPRLRYALKKYGTSEFVVIPLFISTTGTDGLLKIESELIAAYDAVTCGFNIQRNARGIGPYGEHFGAIVSKSANKAETKALKSASIRAALAQPEIRKRMMAKLGDPDFCKHRGMLLSAALSGDSEAAKRHADNFDEIRSRPDVRAKILAHVTGCIYITDGVATKRIRPNDPIPDGWRRGHPATIRTQPKP